PLQQPLGAAGGWSCGSFGVARFGGSRGGSRGGALDLALVGSRQRRDHLDVWITVCSRFNVEIDPLPKQVIQVQGHPRIREFSERCNQQRVGLSAFIQEGQGLAPVVGLTLPGEERSNWVLPVNAQEAEPDLVRQLLALLASFLLGSVGGQVPRLPLRFGNVRNLCDVLPLGWALAL